MRLEWYKACIVVRQVVLSFPGVVIESWLWLGWGKEMGFCWKGLGDEPLSIFWGMSKWLRI